MRGDETWGDLIRQAGIKAENAYTRRAPGEIPIRRSASRIADRRQSQGRSQSRAGRCACCCHAGSGLGRQSLNGLTRGLLWCVLPLGALLLGSPLLSTLLLVISALLALLLVGDGLVDDFLADGLHHLEQNAGVGRSER